MPLSLCHINNTHRLLSLSCCLLWPVEQPQHLNIKLFNQHVIRSSTGRSRLSYCKLSCWHMLLSNGLTADFAYITRMSLSDQQVGVYVQVCVSSCQLPVVFYSFVSHSDVNSWQGKKAASKNIPQRAGAVFPHDIIIPV